MPHSSRCVPRGLVSIAGAQQHPVAGRAGDGTIPLRPRDYTYHNKCLATVADRLLGSIDMIVVVGLVAYAKSRGLTAAESAVAA